jgi:hypothetical protein
MNGRRRFWLLVLVGAVVIVIALLGLDYIQSRRIRQSIAKAKSICARLPLDSSRPDVERFLSERGIEHYFRGASKDRSDVFIESAIVRTVCGKRLVTCDVILTYSFDDRNQLTNCTAQDVYSGP